MLHNIWKRVSREVILFFAFFLPDDKKKALERRLRGQEEFRKLKLADVVIVSFGKSGRTWVRVLLSRFFQLRFGLKPSAFIGFDNLHRQNDGIPRVFFTHDNYLRDYTGNRDNKKDSDPAPADQATPLSLTHGILSLRPSRARPSTQSQARA